jgi:4-amino-4-deoxy-L-arabinose transferase-like glycosyltransferase
MVRFHSGGSEALHERRRRRERTSPLTAPTPIFSKPRPGLFLLLVLLWAAIYLPGLGTPELKGEEARRILPAITMLQTGNFLVPYVGGVPYLRKPPLVNWLIAGSFKVTGSRTEWAARLPSVLAMLALAAVIVALGTGRGWMNAETAFVAAALVLTPAAVLDKGRLAEIEAVYLAVSGIATVVWLAWWTQRRSPWLLWLVPSCFLGVGLLAKAPLHLLFFYAVVLAVLGYSREWRLLWHPAHFVGVALAAAIFLAWAVPYFRSPEAAQAAEIWHAQSVGRITGRFDWGDWLTNIPRALTDHLPWILFAPLLWRRELAALGERELALFRGVRLAVVACFFALLLVPGVLPRYTLPLLAPFACLLAFSLADHRLPPPAAALRAWWRVNGGLALAIAVLALAAPIALAMADRRELLPLGGTRARSGAGFALYANTILAAAAALTVAIAAWLGRRRLARPVFLAATSVALIGAGMFLYTAAALPLMSNSDKYRPMAQAIEETVPPGTQLCAYDPDYQPVLFYLQRPVVYAPHPEDIPAATEWLLTPVKRKKELLRKRPDLQVVRELPEGKTVQMVVLRTRG